MARRPDAQRQGGDEDQRQRRAGEQQGGRQEVQQVVQHRALGGIGETEIRAAPAIASADTALPAAG